MLHQNGYDVITATEANKAKELIITAEPNMVIAGADLQDNDGKYLYDLLEENERTASIPLLLIADPEGRQLSYPDEVILPRPFDPKEFIEKVRLFVGGGTQKAAEEKVSEVDAFSADNVDDDFLDAALGIDHAESIDVESSEEMDKTTITEKNKQAKKKKKTADFGIAQPDYNEKESNETGKVESLMIMEDGSTKKPTEKAEPPELSASSKIDIPTDQFGISKPAQEPEAKKETADHDYDWFIKEMKKDIEGALPPKEKPDKDTKLETTSTSEGLEQVKPPSPIQEKPVSKEPEPGQPEISDGGVDQFISDFKKEMQDLSVQEPADTIKPEQPVSSHASPPDEIRPMDSHESGLVGPDDIDRYMETLIQQLSLKLAEQIAGKISKEELRNLILESLPQIISAKK